MYYDAHIHSTHSADGTSPLGDYTAVLDEGRIAGIGFAEHLDLMPEGGSYGRLDSIAYAGEVGALRDRGYKAYAGCEVDYNKKIEKDIIAHLGKYKYDFVMYSVHMIDGESISDRVYLPALNDPEELRDKVVKYYQEMKWSFKSDIFDVVGHVGVFKRYLGEAYYKDSKLQRFVLEAENEIAGLCAASGKVLEVNSSGLFSPLGETVPGKAFLKLYYDRGGRAVCAGSDAHGVSAAGRGIKEAYALIKETGFDYITLPWDREHPVRLDV